MDPYNYSYDDATTVQPAGLTAERAAAIIILAALGLLILINRGFRGVSVGGASVRVG